MMEKKMSDLDIPPIPEFLEMISDTGAGMFACKASVDMFDLTAEDFIPQVDDIITVGEFYENAAEHYRRRHGASSGQIGP
jgi:peroxiredoxin family protein